MCPSGPNPCPTRPLLGTAAAVLLSALACLPASPAGAADARAYDVLRASYGKYTRADEPRGFAMKVWALGSGKKYTFWRGTRDLYFYWARDHARDWLADRDAYVTAHGDLHLGNMGTYVREAEAPGTTTFGPVDFDESARLPFQLELLQGLVMLRLVADENDIDLTRGRREELIRTLVEEYGRALTSAKTTTALVSNEQRIGRFLDASRKRSYDATLLKFTDGHGKFRANVVTKADEPKEMLEPAPAMREPIARGLAQAVRRSPGAQAAFRYDDEAAVLRAVKDVALRTRLESVGSQGLKKYLVLLDKPLRGLDMDVVMYVKQEVPAAAERAGAIPPDPRSPGRRCSEDMDLLTNPGAYLNTWCDIGKESFWVTFKEPWSKEIESEEVKDYPGLLAAARVWGKVAGAMHRGSGNVPAIRARLTADLSAALRHRCTSYLAELGRQYADFTSDPRVKDDRARAQAAVDGARAEIHSPDPGPQALRARAGR